MDMPPQETVIAGALEKEQKKLDADDMYTVLTAGCFWDPTPRTTPHWLDLGMKYRSYGGFYYAYPDSFRTILRGMKQKIDALPEGAWGKKIFMLDNWNEWDEGHYISPSHEFGFRYLQAIREELTACDNLPDYRLPQDLGLSENLNKSWTAPDLGPVCKEKFNL